MSNEGCMVVSRSLGHGARSCASNAPPYRHSEIGAWNVSGLLWTQLKDWSPSTCFSFGPVDSLTRWKLSTSPSQTSWQTICPTGHTRYICTSHRVRSRQRIHHTTGETSQNSQEGEFCITLHSLYCRLTDCVDLTCW